MEIKEQKLEAQIAAAKGWWRLTTKDQMRAGFRRLANLKAQRSPEYIRELDFQMFGYYL
jgi:hypothetical protein